MLRAASYFCLRTERRRALPLQRARYASSAQKNDSDKGKARGKGDGSKEGDQSQRITPRSQDYFAWYSDVISAADMVDPGPVRGCMVIKPWGMGIWDLLKEDVDRRIKDTGTENAYFPLFIPLSYLSKEAEHVEGFAKECAVVTHHRLKAVATPGKTTLVPDPEAELEEPLVIRPTSETIIWSMFSKWVVSHRDLPLKINQWANVVRWEMRTRPFLRTSEFLWQEGHTAHASEAEARALTRQILDMYASACEELLALPTVRGVKSPSERFAGAEETYTIEAIMQNGWALQSGTSHFLGQNFSKAFDVSFIDPSNSNYSASNNKNKNNSKNSSSSDVGSKVADAPDSNRSFAWATSWGISTRLIGAMVMTHSDDKGLVLPPRVAPLQLVIVPIGLSSKDAEEGEGVVLARCNELQRALKSRGIRAKVDTRDHLRPGSKFFEWERKGVPIRIDIGPRDLAQGAAAMSVRFNGAKIPVGIADQAAFVAAVQSQLGEIHTGMLTNAKSHLLSKVFRVNSYTEMKDMLKNEKSTGNLNKIGFFLAPWRCDALNEEFIKQDCKATIRCYPLEEGAHFDLPPLVDKPCFFSGLPATHWAMFARNF